MSKGKITEAQKQAIKAIYDRGPIYLKGGLVKPVSYLQFRRTVKHGYDCLMVEWCGMWLGIEADGYTHS